jgi:hypothetical protein
VAVVVEPVLPLAAADEEDAAEEEMAVDVAVLVAEAIVGVVDATGASAVLDAEVVVEASSVLKLLAEVSGRGEVVEAVSEAAGCAGAGDTGVPGVCGAGEAELLSRVGSSSENATCAVDVAPAVEPEKLAMKGPFASCA